MVIDVPPPLPDPDRTLAVLQERALSRYDRVPLQFTFEAPGHRSAAALAADLRPLATGGVRIRRMVSPADSGRARWTVTMETAPEPLQLESVFLWEIEMHALQRAHRDCTFVGWTPVLPDS